MKKLLCGLMLVAAFMAAGPAYALDLDEHVSLAPNGRGDLLFYPVYVALDGGWETKIVVVNTSTVYSTVAKVVLRSFVYSKEILDFLIYLSPTDVWTGKIIYGPNGPRLFSDDDSILVAPNVFASPANPVQQDISATVCADDSKVFGYVEVFENWSTSLGPKPVPKWLAPPNSSASVKGAYDIATQFITRNILAGHYEIVNETLGVSGVQEATVLKDYDIFAKLSIAGAGAETVIGLNAFNNNCEVEAVLSKSDIGLYFYDNDVKYALPILTFPTKLVANDACVCGDNLPPTTTNAALKLGPTFGSPFFTTNTTGDDHLTQRCYRIAPPFLLSDLLETTSESPLFSPAPSGATEPIEEEVHFIIKDYFFDEGWIEMPLNYTTTCAPLIGSPQLVRYTGAPVILTTLFLGGDGLGLMTGNWTFGDVDYDDDGTGFFNLLYNYQLDDNTLGQ